MQSTAMEERRTSGETRSRPPWLARIPVTSVGVIPGLAAQSLLFKYLASLPWVHLSDTIHVVLWFISLVVSSVAAIVYALKALRYPRICSWELYHPLRHNDFFLFLIGAFLMTLAYPESFLGHANFEIPFCILTILHLIGCLFVYGGWMSSMQKPKLGISYRDAEPSYLFTLVPWFLSSSLGALIGWVEVATFLFYVGSFYWIVMYVSLWQNFSMAREHLETSGAVPQVFLTVAPSAIASLAWVNISRATLSDMPSGTTDYLGHIGRFFLFNSLAAGVLIVPTLWRAYLRTIPQKSYLPWWAATFPTAAVAMATSEYSKVVNTPTVHVLMWICCGIAWGTFLFVLVWNLQGIFTWRAWKDPLLEKEHIWARTESTHTEMEEVRCDRGEDRAESNVSGTIFA
ncbi:hypothetical protein SpCBS45565_g00652 [Spizellomyces sp. 'palustris']|nr:hypothetical protein SpCBS45565_g00652 [Spizellomyces sp. 'palustris']